MKKYIITLIILFLPYIFNAQVTKNNLSGKIGISLYGGANVPTNGDISSTVKTTDFLNSGPQFGLGVSYFFTKAIGVEAITNYDLNFFKDKFRLSSKKPSVATLSVSLNGIYNFGHLFSNTRISPFARAGVGIYNWRHLDDAPCKGGEVINMDGIEHKASSFGFNVGIGADYSINKKLSVGVIFDYNMYFPKDENKFGKDFAEQGNFTPQLKLSYYLPTN